MKFLIRSRENGDLNNGLRNFSILCDIANSYDMKIGIENLPWSVLNTPLSVFEFINLSKYSNTGIVIDAFQFFKSGSSLSVFSTSDHPLKNI